MSGRGVCFDWMNKGACLRGNSCKFDHTASMKGQGKRSSGPKNQNARGGGGGKMFSSQGTCYDFQRTGGCRYGSSCKYSHPGAPGQGSTPSSVPQRGGQHFQKSESMVKFIKALATIRKDKLGAELLKSRDLWLRCWKNEDLLDDSSRRMMLEILARIPGSSSTEPPPIEFLKK